jgi:hypothetical protein
MPSRLDRIEGRYATAAHGTDDDIFDLVAAFRLSVAALEELHAILTQTMFGELPAEALAVCRSWTEETCTCPAICPVHDRGTFYEKT